MSHMEKFGYSDEYNGWRFNLSPFTFAILESDQKHVHPKNLRLLGVSDSEHVVTPNCGGSEVFKGELRSPTYDECKLLHEHFPGEEELEEYFFENGFFELVRPMLVATIGKIDLTFCEKLPGRIFTVNLENPEVFLVLEEYREVFVVIDENVTLKKVLKLISGLGQTKVCLQTGGCLAKINLNI